MSTEDQSYEMIIGRMRGKNTKQRRTERSVVVVQLN